MTSVPASPAPTAEDEVVELCSRPDPDRHRPTRRRLEPGGARGGEYVAGKLAEVGIEPTLLESEPGRASVVARIAGADPARPALLVHGHLDVVPADPADWTVHPFAGEVRDGCVWGRGAVDMKDMDAMIAGGGPGLGPDRAAAAAGRRAGLHRRRGGRRALRARTGWSTTTRSCSRAAPRRSARSAGSRVTVARRPAALPVQTAEKGIAWLRLTAPGGRRARLDACTTTTR